MSSKGRVAAGVVVVAAVAGAGWYWYNAEAHIAPTTLTLYGNVDIREVELGFRVPGRITEVLVDEGDVVTKGQRLATHRLRTVSAGRSARRSARATRAGEHGEVRKGFAAAGSAAGAGARRRGRGRVSERAARIRPPDRHDQEPAAPAKPRATPRRRAAIRRPPDWPPSAKRSRLRTKDSAAKK